MIQEESGQHITLTEECRKCGESKPTGLSWVEDGGLHFKCDLCGRHMFLGYLEEATQEMVEAKYAYVQAAENRKRYFDEKDTQIRQAFERDKESLKADPDYIKAYAHLFEPAAFAMNQKGGEGWHSKD